MTEPPHDLKSTVKELGTVFGRDRVFDSGRGYGISLMDVAQGARSRVLTELSKELDEATKLCEERDNELAALRTQVESKELELARALATRYAAALALEAAENALPVDD